MKKKQKQKRKRRRAAEAPRHQSESSAKKPFKISWEDAAGEKDAESGAFIGIASVTIQALGLVIRFVICVRHIFWHGL